MELIDGMKIVPLKENVDFRGSFTEIYRKEWGVSPELIQWNFVRSEPGVLRGVHIHPTHRDYYIAVGKTIAGICDTRIGSPTEGMSIVTEIGVELAAVFLPPGVAHGFYFCEKGVQIYAVSHYYDPINDEYACRYDDPDLGLDWPIADPILSEKDTNAPSLSEMRHVIPSYESYQK